jgi:hypothetical protein
MANEVDVMVAAHPLGEAARVVAGQLLKAERQAESLLAREGEQVESSKEAFIDAIRGAKDDLMAATLAAMDDAKEKLASDLMPALAEAMRSLREDAVPGLAASLEEALEALGLGHEVVESMGAFAPPLEWARGIVGTIGELLEAMNLGL